MSWFYLILAGLFEVAWAVGFKHAFRANHWLTGATLAAMGASFWFLWLALRTLPVGTAYAVWTGVGAAGAALVGVLALGEPATAPRLACIGLILAGVVGLRLVTP